MEIKLKVERLEGGRAFLRDEKGRLIVWPRDFLPEDAAEGQMARFESLEKDKIDSSNQSAKDILNEIFLS